MNLAMLAHSQDTELLNRLAQRAAIRRNRQDDTDLARIEARMLAHDRKIAQRERKQAILAARRNKRQRQEFEAGDI